MHIDGSVALVTGASRGLGAAFARRLLERGAARVYAGVRNPDAVTVPGLIPVRLDVTSASDVAAAASVCGEVTLLINNAGILTGSPVLGDAALDDVRRAMETNFFGPLAMSRAFAPVLARNGGGALVNVLSVLSWLTFPSAALYAATKSAAWSLTNALRIELQRQGTLVVGVHCGYIDTEMAAAVNGPKTSPDVVVARTLDAVESGEYEVLVDETSRRVRAALGGDLAALYPALRA